MASTAKRAELRNKASSLANRATQQTTPRGMVVTPRGTRRAPSVQSPTIRNKLVQPIGTRSSLPSRLQQQRGGATGSPQQSGSGGGFGSPQQQQRQASPPPAVRQGGCSMRGKAVAQMTSGGDAGAGQPVQISTSGSGGLGQQVGQQPCSMAGSPLLGLDFAMLAQRASPCSKHRLETLLQELSQEIGRIASGSGEDEGAGAASVVPALTHLRDVNEVDSVSSTVATVGGPDAKVVERLCERVHGMQVALQGTKRPEQEHEVSLCDSPSDEPTGADGLGGHQLSHLEKLICSLQAKVDETVLPGEAVGKFRMELSVLEQQKMTLQEEVLRLQRISEQQKMTLQEEVLRLQQRMDEMGQQHQAGAAGTSACAAACPSSAAEQRQRSPSPEPSSTCTSWPGNSGRPGATKPPVIPRLHLGAVQVTPQVTTLSPPHSGRAEHGPALLHSRPASLQLPPAGNFPHGGQQMMTPRALQAHCGAAQEDATPVIPTTSGSVLTAAASSSVQRPGLSGSRVHLAASPLHHRTNSATAMMAQPQPQQVHQGYGSRPMTPGISQRIQMAEPMNVGAHRVWAYPAVVSNAVPPRFAFQHRG
eukprot:TRINITY_DN2075_c0_g1_i1.p1 TRINITY_DN2075_c0_g1~~TRINITY_DN2075_c0_g1_i1.p1  ORF type:complete len:590 (-),score=120.41 TRINITY_DN2075_c0_g1_i1:69-1838(-)